MIPYEEIDSEIRRLVRLVNEFPGVRTLHSCAGHEDGAETYVSFAADSQDDLRRLLAALPLLSWRGALVANRFEWGAVWVSATLDDDATLRYDLRIDGGPRYAQRKLLGEVEESLSAALVRHAEGYSSEASSFVQA